jgi:hypothetical protein
VFEDTESEKYKLIDSDLPSLPSTANFEPGDSTSTELSTEPSIPASIANPARKHVKLSPLLAPPPQIDPYLFKRWTTMPPLAGYVVGSYVYDQYQKFKKAKRKKNALEITQSVVQEANGSRSTRVRNFTTQY